MKLSLIPVIILCVYPSFCMSKENNTGIGFTTDLGFKLMKNLGLHQFGIGFQFEENKRSHEDLVVELNSYNLGMSYKYYFSENSKISKFYEIDMTLGYGEYVRTFNEEVVNGSGPNDYLAHYGVGALAGLEYFISSSFSIEGKAGISYTYTPDYIDFDSQEITKIKSVVSINYYW